MKKRTKCSQPTIAYTKGLAQEVKWSPAPRPPFVPQDLSKANEDKAKRALAGSSAANKAKVAERQER